MEPQHVYSAWACVIRDMPVRELSGQQGDHATTMISPFS